MGIQSFLFCLFFFLFQLGANTMVRLSGVLLPRAVSTLAVLGVLWFSLFASSGKNAFFSFSSPRSVSLVSMHGVDKEIVKPGDGKTYPKKGDKVHMHYTGTLTNGGKTFDSSLNRGVPFVTEIGVWRVIKGWDEGVPQMSLG